MIDIEEWAKRFAIGKTTAEEDEEAVKKIYGEQMAMVKKAIKEIGPTISLTYRNVSTETFDTTTGKPTTPHEKKPVRPKRGGRGQRRGQPRPQ